jgi:hypothetical protein
MRAILAAAALVAAVPANAQSHIVVWPTPVNTHAYHVSGFDFYDPATAEMAVWVKLLQFDIVADVDGTVTFGDFAGQVNAGEHMTFFPNVVKFSYFYDAVVFSVSRGVYRNALFSNLVFEVSDQTMHVPEPANWALMIGGFAIAGGAMRYRRRTTRVRFATV